MQVELLYRQIWTMRLKLANAIFEYLEIFHNRRRRHGRLGGRTQPSTRCSARPHTLA
jgi:putative transposase